MLHHVTMAYDLDGDMMWELLRLEQPKSTDKSVASAVKRVSPLRRFTELSHSACRETLTTAFSSIYRTRPSSITQSELDQAHRLINEKYATQEWRYRVK